MIDFKKVRHVARPGKDLRTLRASPEAHRDGPKPQLTTVSRLDPQAPCVPPVGWPQPNAPGRSPGSLASRPSLSRFDVLRTVHEGFRSFTALDSANPSIFRCSTERPRTLTERLRRSRSPRAPRTLRRPPADPIHAPSFGSPARTADQEDSGPPQPAALRHRASLTLTGATCGST